MSPAPRIAIVGRACHLPGADSPAALWEAVVAGRDLLGPAPAGRWGLAPADALCSPEAPHPDQAWTDRGGRCAPLAFDGAGFRVPAADLTGLDPLVHLVLHTARAALHDAGIDPLRADLARAGSFVGNLSFPSAGFAAYAERVWWDGALGPALRRAAGIPDGAPLDRFMSGLPARLLGPALGLGGGNVALDAACASSLYAIGYAVQRLAAGEIDLALAGAVNRADNLFLHVGFSALKALSRSGRSRPFHAGADGLVPAEGAGFVVLKRLEDALRDGDTIHGVIRGVGLSNDGRGRGMLAPSEDGQRRAIAAAWAQSGLSPSDLGLLECHATGTPVGDATELRSTAAAFGALPRPLPIGSLKSNLGHLITAAGVAGLIKVLEALRAGVRPPTLHVDTPNPALDGAPFRLLTAAEPWDGPRRAAVSAFGFGGNNAHLIVEAWEPGPAPLPAPARTAPVPLAITAIAARVGSAPDAATLRAALHGGPLGADSPPLALPLDGLRFPPADLAQALPQQLVLLDAARALLHGDAPPPAARTAVYIAMGADAEVCRYGARWRLVARGDALGQRPWALAARDAVVPALEAPAVVGTMPNIPANRLNSQWDLGAGSCTVSAEEAGGIEALRLAGRALADGSIDAALVGAVDLCAEPVHAAALAALGSPVAPGDAAVLLRVERLSDATARGARVLAIVDPSADARAVPVLPAESRAGQAHAASSLVAVAAAAIHLHQRSLPGGAPWLAPGSRALAVATPALGGAPPPPLALREAPGHAPSPVHAPPVLRTFAAESAAGLRQRVAAGDAGGAGPHRLALHAPDAAAADALQAAAAAALAAGAPLPVGVWAADTGALSGEGLAIGFGGAGAAGPGTGQALLRALPTLADGLLGRGFSRLAAAVFPGPGAGPSVLPRLWAASAHNQLQATLVTEVLGLRPALSVGYSSGETNALFASGAWSGVDAFQSEAEESALFTRLLGGPMEAVARAWGVAQVAWGVYAVRGPVADVQAALHGEPRAHLAIVHTDTDSVIAGDAAACQRVLARLGHPVVPVPYPLAVHVPEVAEVAALWRRLHHRPVSPPAWALTSNGVGGPVAPTAEAIAEAHLAQATGTLDLRPTLRAAAGARLFLDLGPGPHLGRWARAVLGPTLPVVSLDPSGPAGPVAALFDAAAAAWAHGLPVRLDTLAAAFPPDALAAPPAPARVLTVPLHRPPVRLPPVPAPAPAPEPPSMRAPDSAGMPLAPGLPPTTARVVPAAPPPVAPPALPAVVAPVAPPADTSALSPHIPAQAPPFSAPAVLDPSNPFAAHAAAQALAFEAHQRFLADAAALQARFLQSRQVALVSMLQAAGGFGSVFSEGGGASPPATPPLAPPPVPVPPPVVAPDQPPAPAAAPAPAPAPAPPAPLAAPAPVVASGPAAPAPAPRAALRAPSADPGSPAPRGLTLGREGLLVHSRGEISTIYGPLFRPQDGYARQCRMPEPPLLLADRMTGLDAVPGSMGTGTIWTETDVRPDAWYLHEGRMPAGVMIESGQADLMLISYLGVDLQHPGDRVYRLLGCTLTYHDSLPQVGDTLCYDIHVDGHARQGDIRLFFFHYDCRVNGQRRLTVRNGQAGFFTDAELADSAGILWSPEAQEVVADPRLDAPLLPLSGTAFSADQVRAFAAGDLAGCFGPAFHYGRTHTQTPRIQSGRMLFLHRVSALEPRGGPWGRGYLRAEQDIASSDWFFDGHFKNDPCMPGTLMFEGCLQAMAFYLAAMGVTVSRDGWRFEPVPGAPFDLKCRGQVVPENKLLTYEIFIEEFEAGPIPTLWADLLCTCDGLKGFHARRVGLRLVPDWPLTRRPELLDLPEDPRPLAIVDGFRFDYASLLACAWGRPSEAFGPMYRPFDGTRRVARLPGPPYHFMSRVSRLDGPLGAFQPGPTVEILYDIPPDAWYFNENGTATMPFAVLLEAALQPCGWLASAVGSALTTEEDLSFRNLDGTGTLHRELFRTAGTLRTVVQITKISRSAGMIIEGFAVECFLGDDPAPVYTMSTVFGFFPKAALENQVGLSPLPAHSALLTADSTVSVDLRGSPSRWCGGSARLARPMLRMLDRVTGHWPTGGEAGLGAARAEKDVNSAEWFFKAHFYQDPVQPGSLGIEAMIQLLQWMMITQGMVEDTPGLRFEPIETGAPLTWKYRGQVVPKNALIQSTVEITEVGRDERGPWARARASLWVDGKRIYEAQNLGMRAVSTPAPGGPGDEAPPPVTETTLSPTTDPWVNDHRPTFTVAALPFFTLVDRIAAAVPGPIRGLRDVVVRRWVPVTGPVRLTAALTDEKADTVRVRLSVDFGAGPEEVATARVLRGSPDAGPPALPAFDGPPAADPYATGQLFHGPAFQVLQRLVPGPGGASAVLDASPGPVPVGRLHPRLLDGATHALPHDALSTWDPAWPADQVAYPVFLSALDLFAPFPTAGRVRVEARADGDGGGPTRPAFRVQWIDGDRVLAQARLIEATFPKGPIGSAPPAARRAFLAAQQPVPGLRLSRVGADGVSRLSRAEVAASDWLPGTVSATWGSTVPADIVAREHQAAREGVHPGRLPAALPLNPPRLRAFTDGEDACAADDPAAPVGLDLGPVRDFWDRWFNRGGAAWPVEDLYYGLLSRFVRRVIIEDPAAFAALRGRSVLYLANHQTGIESLLFSIVASALVEVPTLTLAKAEHRESWLGTLIQLCFSYPGIQDPKVIAYFDRDDKASLPRIIGELAAEMRAPGRGVLVHVEGTRARSARHDTRKMSGAFVDMAIEVDAPVVPVRFVGGLPVTPLDTRTEFPVGMGQQDLWIGRPLDPAALARVPYGERKARVLDGIARLGPPTAEEQPLPGDPAFAARVAATAAARGISPDDAVLIEVLREAPQPCDETRALLAALDGGPAPAGPWAAALLRRLGRA